MSARQELRLLFQVSKSHSIARRYFVVNGFDGTLTMLGIIMGFYLSEQPSVDVIIHACLGAAIALGVSGFSSAYISESAERKQELDQLAQAMATDLGESAHAKAARYMPALIALVNSLAPVLFSLIILMPLWQYSTVTQMGFNPLISAITLALIILFFLGVFLSKVSGSNWIFSGLRSVFIGLLTCGIILLFTS